VCVCTDFRAARRNFWLVRKSIRLTRRKKENLGNNKQGAANLSNIYHHRRGAVGMACVYVRGIILEAKRKRSVFPANSQHIATKLLHILDRRVKKRTPQIDKSYEIDVIHRRNIKNSKISFKKKNLKAFRTYFVVPFG